MSYWKGRNPFLSRAGFDTMEKVTEKVIEWGRNPFLSRAGFDKNVSIPCILCVFGRNPFF
jgi:hypothetical protein